MARRASWRFWNRCGPRRYEPTLGVTNADDHQSNTMNRREFLNSAAGGTAFIGTGRQRRGHVRAFSQQPEALALAEAAARDPETASEDRVAVEQIQWRLRH